LGTLQGQPAELLTKVCAEERGLNGAHTHMRPQFHLLASDRRNQQETVTIWGHTRHLPVQIDQQGQGRAQNPSYIL